MLDLGMLMYGGLLVLAIWRSVCFYRCCGLWLSILNYTSLLYLVLVAACAYVMVVIYQCMQQPLATHLSPEANVWTYGWLQPFVMTAPGAVVVTIVLNWFQTEGHIFEIHKDVGVIKHDRAVQIIALPGVFGVMAMAAMVPMLELVTDHSAADPWPLSRMTFPGALSGNESLLHVGASRTLSSVMQPKLTAIGSPQGNLTAAWTESFEQAKWRYETCFYVGDLFEAWALYQFGKLSLELIRENYLKQSRSDVEAEQRAARDLLAQHRAVESLTWLGTIAFVIVCVCQTACSLWPYVGGDTEWLQSLILGFEVAGFVASGAAIYNVFVVERAFHESLAPCSPVLKFLSVKLLVSLSFFQKGILVALQACNQLLPGVIQDIVKWVPLVGDLVNMTEVQIHIFYPSLILFECLLAAIMHLWAWKATEEWYKMDDRQGTEREPLMPKKDPELAAAA